MTVEQDNYIRCLPDLFARFGAEWKARWDRHQDIEDHLWDPIVQFADLALPRPDPMPYAPITVEERKATLKQKRKSADRS